MSELDKQLENMHEVFFVNSHHMLDKDRLQRHTEQIKQVFIDAGWTEADHLPAVQQNLINNVKNGTRPLIKSDFGFSSDYAPLMTGQEFYDRFDEIWGDMYREKKNPLTADEFVKAAKKAAGIEQ